MENTIIIEQNIPDKLLHTLQKESAILDSIMGNKKKVPDPSFLARIGNLLWQASRLKAGEVLEAIKTAQSQGKLVRFCIVATKPEIRALPWELLYHSVGLRPTT